MIMVNTSWSIVGQSWSMMGQSWLILVILVPVNHSSSTLQQQPLVLPWTSRKSGWPGCMLILSPLVIHHVTAWMWLNLKRFSPTSLPAKIPTFASKVYPWNATTVLIHGLYWCLAQSAFQDLKDHSNWPQNQLGGILLWHFCLHSSRNSSLRQ